MKIRLRQDFETVLPKLGFAHGHGHIHLIVRAPGYHTLVTHLFDAASDYLDSDAVFAVKRSLLRDFESRRPDDPHRPAGVDRTWFSVKCDLVLAPAR